MHRHSEPEEECDEHDHERRAKASPDHEAHLNDSAEIHGSSEAALDVSENASRDNADTFGQLGSIERRDLMAESKARAREAARAGTDVGPRSSWALDVDRGTTTTLRHPVARLNASWETMMTGRRPR